MRAIEALLVTLSVGLVNAQSVRLERNLGTAQAEYHAAEEKWLRSDPRLESDLLRSNSQEVRGRIRRAAALRDDVMQKKITYLDLVVKRMSEVESKMTPQQKLAIPTEEFRKELQGEQERLRDEQDRLSGRIHELPTGDEYAGVRTTMEQEKSDIAQMQVLATRRMEALEKLSKAQEADNANPDDVPQKFSEIRKIWEGERDRSVRAKAAWATYYVGLERTLASKGGSKPTPEH